MSQLNVTHTVKEMKTLPVRMLDTKTGTYYFSYIDAIIISQDDDIVVIVDDIISTYPDIDCAARDLDFSLDLDVGVIELGITITPVYRK